VLNVPDEPKIDESKDPEKVTTTDISS